MKVLMFSPGFPAEMPFFTRGLAEVGAQVYGIGDQPEGLLPPDASESLVEYVRVTSLWDEEEMLRAVDQLHWRVGLDRIECLWEPGMLLAARLREEHGIPGMTVAETVPFRDKGKMKEVLDEAGVRTPRYRRASGSEEIRAAAEAVGLPIVVKPIAGAGSADTHRVESSTELETVLNSIEHVEEVSVEEYIEGEEYTFDTISVDGEIAYFNIAWYRPKPIVARSVEWISPQTVTLKNVAQPALQPGGELGVAVLKALGFRTGFTHMEWFLTPNGEAVFGEIGARPPGGRSVDIMNYGCDIDVYRGWAEAVCHSTFSQRVERRYNAAVIFKRAHGDGQIERIEGLRRLLERYGEHVVHIDLLPVGSPRRNWRQTLISDGYLILRHPDLAHTLEMADRVGTDLQMYARAEE